MNDITSTDLTASADPVIDLTGFDPAGAATDAATYGWEPEHQPFKPGYPVIAGTRILRARLRADDGGVATATFTGTLDGTRAWVEANTRGTLSLYAEVERGDGDLQTELRVALVPTGKRVPENALRLGGARGTHAYLLSIETAPKPPTADDTPAALTAAAQAYTDGLTDPAQTAGPDDAPSIN